MTDDNPLGFGYDGDDASLQVVQEERSSSPSIDPVLQPLHVPVGGLDPDDDGFADPLADAKFRFCAKRVFLTYTNLTCGFECKSLFLQTLRRRFSAAHNPLTAVIVGHERHATGAHHFHCYLKWTKEVDTYNPRFFDIDCGYCGFHHPNIKKAKGKNPEFDFFHYCAKDGDFIAEGIRMFPNSTNYKRRKEDLELWIADVKRHRGIDPSDRRPVSFPIPIVIGEYKSEIPLPDASDKRRCHLLLGPPGCGKTPFLNSTLGDTQSYLVSHPQYPMEDYQGEQVIIFDDYNPEMLKREFLINLLNVHRFPNVHAGWARGAGNKVYLPKNQVRVLIILCNRERMPPWFATQDTAMMDRCVIHDLYPPQ